MRQFDVYPNPFDSRGFAPLVVVLSSHLADVSAAIIAPLLIDRRATMSAEVAVELGGVSYVLSLIDMASTDPKLLRDRAGSLANAEYDIRRGLDRIFTGF